MTVNIHIKKALISWFLPVGVKPWWPSVQWPDALWLSCWRLMRAMCNSLDSNVPKWRAKFPNTGAFSAINYFIIRDKNCLKILWVQDIGERNYSWKKHVSGMSFGQVVGTFKKSGFHSVLQFVFWMSVGQMHQDGKLSLKLRQVPLNTKQTKSPTRQFNWQMLEETPTKDSWIR